MFIERLSLTNFRCFGPEATSVDLTSGLTTFVGVNGAGKTALMQALQRLFGVTAISDAYGAKISMSLPPSLSRRSSETSS